MRSNTKADHVTIKFVKQRQILNLTNTQSFIWKQNTMAKILTESNEYVFRKSIAFRLLIWPESKQGRLSTCVGARANTNTHTFKSFYPSRLTSR